MLTRIKSSKVFKELFSHLQKKTKLKIIYLNKFLVTKLSVTLEDYKLFSEKYKIIDSNGIEKVYSIYNNIIIYEYNKKNKQGKIYDQYGTKIYEGGLINGNKYGIGKEYYYNNKLKFEGEYKNNKKWNGKGYDFKGNIKYEIKNGNGKIIEYYDYYLKEKIKFVGELLNGEISGLGKEYFYKTGKIEFEGEYRHGKKNGRGKEYYMEKKLKIKYGCKYFENIKWEGIGYGIKGNQNCVIKKGKIYDNNNNLIYEEAVDGEVKQEKNNKLTFKGKYKNKEKYGKCVEYNSEGELLFEGIYLNGRKNGKGKEYENGQLIYEGNYLNDTYNGEGVKYNNNGKINFEGEYINGKMGKGKLYNDDNELIFQSEFLDGKKWSEIGKEYYNDGKIMFEGEIRNNIKFNGKLFDKYNNDIYEIKNGKGKIKLYSYSGKLLYVGELLNGKKHGWGLGYRNFGRKFEGEIIDDKWKRGKEYKNGKLIYEGEYLNEQKNGKGKE